MPATLIASQGLYDTLVLLADLCNQSEQQYRAWAPCAVTNDLRAVLLRRVEERAAAAAELQQQIDGLSGTVPAAAVGVGAGRAMPLTKRRATPLSMPAVLSVPPSPMQPLPGEALPPACLSGSDIALLAECEACEARAIEAYWHALAAPLPRRVRLLLQNQYAAIKRSHRRALVMRYLALGRLDVAAAPVSTMSTVALSALPRPQPPAALGASAQAQAQAGS